MLQGLHHESFLLQVRGRRLKLPILFRHEVLRNMFDNVCRVLVVIVLFLVLFTDTVIAPPGVLYFFLKCCSGNLNDRIDIGVCGWRLWVALNLVKIVGFSPVVS